MGINVEVSTATPTEPKPKARRGFALLNKDRQREISSMGGKAAQSQPNPRRWDREGAAAAGRIGGRNARGGRGKITPETKSP